MSSRIVQPFCPKHSRFVGDAGDAGDMLRAVALMGLVYLLIVLSLPGAQAEAMEFLTGFGG